VPLEVFAIGLKRKRKAGGADGIRTHDLLDAIEARSQLRHGPTEPPKFTTGLFGPLAIAATQRRAMQPPARFTSLME
jgi:hypothetical protein